MQSLLDHSRELEGESSPEAIPRSIELNDGTGAQSHRPPFSEPVN